MTGALIVTAGALVSRVKETVAEAVLPAVSVSLAVIVCAPSVSVGVKLQPPAAFAVVVPSVVPLSVSVTRALGSPAPKIWVMLVIPSLVELPVSVESTALTVGGLVSRVKVSEVEPAFPDLSVSLAVMVCTPSVSVGVKLQAPVPSAMVVPRRVTPSFRVTTVLASPVPLIAGLLVMRSEDEAPVSCTSAAVTAGGVVSTTSKLNCVAPVLFAPSLADATIV